MARLITANESNATLRRVYFHLIDLSGINPALGEAGGQPEISIDGGAFTSTGISTLTASGNGRYYATLAQNVLVVGRHIETSYQSANVPASPGDSLDVIAVNLNQNLQQAEEISIKVGHK